jgi:hypothetical protein
MFSAPICIATDYIRQRWIADRADVNWQASYLWPRKGRNQRQYRRIDFCGIWKIFDGISNELQPTP